MSRKQVQAEYGGFNDLASFRSETALTPEDISDVDALKVINQDMQEQVRITNLEKAKEREEKARLSNELGNVRSAKSNIERELDNEKRNKIVINPLAPILPLDPFRSPSNMADYYARERLKQEIKDDFARDQRIKQYEKERAREQAKLWKVTHPNPRAKARSRSKSKPKSKARSRSKSKSKTKSRK
jgi:hypothetical protein